ncbi:MAG TPA: hypothetical protein VHL78_03915 [Actinomycetota bacterium]|nr:hypothetical protein [Actinomycetota bacterium]
MAVVRAVVLIAIGAGAVLGVEALLGDERRSAPAGGPPGFAERPPQDPGDPPVVWVDGTVESLTADRVVLRAGEGPPVPLNRLGGGATSFLRLDGGTWRETDPGDGGDVRGQPACVEAALDGRTLLALRVFLGSACGPV